MIKIENKKRIVVLDWHEIRAEYIAGGISQRKLAEKYGVSRTMLERRCRLEHWAAEREAAKAKVQEKVIQKTAEAAADNVVTAERIKGRLLEQLEALIERTQLTATETRDYDFEGNLKEINRLRDLTAAFKDLTGDLPKTQATDDALQHAREILGGVQSVIE